MTLFTRSGSGIANRAQFLEYDFLVLIEARDHGVEGPSAELTYWVAIMKTFGPDGNYRVMRMGNKSGALEYAIKLDEVGSSAYFCCVDRDCDDVVASGEVQPSRTITTANYSFESDLVFAASIKSVLELHLGAVQEVDDFDFDKHLSSFLGDLRWAVCADLLTLQRGEGFFPRDKRAFLSLFDDKEYGQIPKLSRERSIQRLRELSEKYPNPAHTAEVGSFERCYGKLVAWWFYRLVTHIIAVADAKYKLAEEVFRRNLVFVVSQSIGDGSFPLAAHYEKQFSACGATTSG